MLNANQDNKDFSRRKFLKGGLVLGAAAGLSTVAVDKSTEEIAKALGKKELDNFPHEVKSDYKRFPDSRNIFGRLGQGDMNLIGKLQGLPGLLG